MRWFQDLRLTRFQEFQGWQHFKISILKRPNHCPVPLGAPAPPCPHAPLAPLGHPLGPPWAPPGSPFGSLGSPWTPLGPPFRLPLALLGPPWVSLGLPVGPVGSLLGPPGAHQSPTILYKSSPSPLQILAPPAARHNGLTNLNGPTT